MLRANDRREGSTPMLNLITTSTRPSTVWPSSVLSSSTDTYNSGGGELLHPLSEKGCSRLREGHIPSSVVLSKSKEQTSFAAGLPQSAWVKPESKQFRLQKTSGTRSRSKSRAEFASQTA